MLNIKQDNKISKQENADKVKELLLNSLTNYLVHKKSINKNELLKYIKTSIPDKNFENTSIIVSILSLINYNEGERYHKTINNLNEAKHLAYSNNSKLAQKINTFCFALVELNEENTEKALNLLNSAYLTEYDFDELNECILKFQNKAKILFKGNVSLTKSLTNNFQHDALLALLKVGRAVAMETDINSLLTVITEQIQQALNADRCSVFLVDNNELWSKVALGLEVKEIRFPINKGLAGHVALTGETINIKNAYESKYFNSEIDTKTGYKTKNILCMPIRNLSHQIVGVFQVLNKNNGDFTKKDEDLLLAIGSSAGIAIENANLFNRQKKLINDQKQLFSSFIDTLSASIDARDKITSGHSKRVTGYAGLICDKFNLDETEKEKIKNASLLHDIGKIGIKDSVLQKEGRLTEEEYNHIKEHVKFTHNILEKVCTTNNFKDVVKIASSHHEKFDGTGYFKGLSGDKIPLGGRILAVCDVFDAITSRRHYRSKMEITDALRIITEGKNKHFDPEVVNKFMDISTFDILSVMQKEKIPSINSEEQNILKRFKLIELCAILNKERKNSKENSLVNTFNKYYLAT